MSTSTNRWNTLLHQRKATNEILRERKDPTPEPAPRRTTGEDMAAKTPVPEEPLDDARARLEEARKVSNN